MHAEIKVPSAKVPDISKVFYFKPVIGHTLWLYALRLLPRTSCVFPVLSFLSVSSTTTKKVGQTFTRDFFALILSKLHTWLYVDFLGWSVFLFLSRNGIDRKRVHPHRQLFFILVYPNALTASALKSNCQSVEQRTLRASVY